MKFILTFFCFFTFFCSHSQKSQITSIRLNHINATYFKSEIRIFIYSDGNKPKIYVETSEGKKNYSISINEFNELCNAIIKISPLDVIQEVNICLDGGDTEISFSGSTLQANSTKYSVNCLSISDQNTVLKDYLFATNLILTKAKLNFSDLK